MINREKKSFLINFGGKENIYLCPIPKSSIVVHGIVEKWQDY